MLFKSRSLFLFVLVLGCESFEENLDLHREGINTLTIGNSSTIIGGGVGYSGIISSSGTTVNSFAALAASISSATPNTVIYITSDFTFPYPLIIDKDSITIASGRGETATSGATLTKNAGNTEEVIFFKVKANNVKIKGIKFMGGQNEGSNGTQERVGIIVDGNNNLTVENCELQGFARAAVTINNSLGSIVKNNHIHHNRMSGQGYGIEIGGVTSETFVIAEYNLFHDNRHDITGSGNVNVSYEARYNLIEDGVGSAGSFDMHGQAKTNPGAVCGKAAGNRIHIHHNVFMDEYVPTILIRGIPVVQSTIEYNTFVTSQQDAISQRCEWRGELIKANCDVPDTICHSTCFCEWSTTGDINTGELKNITESNNKYLGDMITSGKQDLIILNSNKRLVKYISDGKKYLGTSGEVVGHGFANYTHLFNGHWQGNPTADLIGRTTSGELHLFPYDGNFYDNGGGSTVGHGFNYQNYFVGKFNNDNTTDLIARTSSGILHFYPFSGSFYVSGAGAQVGHGFITSTYQDFLVGNWTDDNNTSDLIIRKTNGDMLLFPFKNNTFYNYDGGQVLGTGFNYAQYLVGDWTGDGKSDLLCRTQSGDFHLYPFHSNSFQPWSVVATGLNYSKYLVGDFIGSSKTDLMAMDAEGNFWLFEYIDADTGFKIPGIKIGAEYAAEEFFVDQWGGL